MSRGITRRTTILAACCALLALGTGLLLRTVTATDDAGPAAAPVAEATSTPAVPVPVTGSPAVPVPTPSAVSTSIPDVPAVPGAAVPGRGASGIRWASFPQLTGSPVGNGSPLRDVRQDQGMSVPLPDGRSIWIFADTTQTVSPTFFVTSSAAVSRYGTRQLSYAATGKHLPVEFLPRTKAERAAGVSGSSYTAVWPTGVTTLPDGLILISYAKYQVTLNPASYTLLGAGLYTFRYHGPTAFRRGAQATRIADNLWSAAEGAIGSPVYADGLVYFTSCENLQCYSVRTTPAGLTAHSSYRWWTGSAWVAGRGLRAPMAYGASKPGLSPAMAYLPALRVYATVGTAAGHVSQTGLLWVAPHPWGPWSKPSSFSLPDCPSAGCYTLNLHPAESVNGLVRVSYATAGVGPYVRIVDLRVHVKDAATWVHAY